MTAWTMSIPAVAKARQSLTSVGVSAIRRKEYMTKQDVLWEDRANEGIEKAVIDPRATGEGLCRINSTGEQAQQIAFGNGHGIADLILGRLESSASQSPGVSLYDNQVCRLRQRYFTKPDEWWDSTSNNVRHDTLRINNWGTPQWLTGAPAWKALSRKGGGSSYNNGNSTDGKHKTGNAVDVFSHQRDALSWTRLMYHHIKCGQGRNALRTFKEMKQNGVAPNSYTFVAALKACRSLQDFETTKQIHAEVVNSIFESDVYVGTLLVDVYMKCGSLVDARCTFESMARHDVVSWNVMISGCAQLQQGEEALQWYSRMQQEGLEPNNRTFVGALKACCCIMSEGIRETKICLEYVRAIHSYALKSLSELDLFVGNMLVDAYAKCGSLDNARQVFEAIPHRDVVSWNTIILGYVQMQDGETALQLYARMHEEGVVPDNRTFVGALKACSSLATSEERNTGKRWCLEQVICIHSELVKGGYEFGVFVGTTLVHVYTKCGILMDARRVFEKMPERDVASWNAMISGYSQMEQGEEALLLYARMQLEGVVPDGQTFIGALKACSSLAALEEWNEVEGRWLKKTCLQQVRAIHLQIVERHNLQMGLSVGNMLVDVYARCGSLVDARFVFETMSNRDVISWNALILGYAQVDEGEEALLLYTWMQQDAVISEDRTFVSALKACSSLAGLEEGIEVEGKRVKKRSLKHVRHIHSDAMKCQLESSVCVGTMLIDAYIKCGSLADARLVFEKMPHRDVVSWTAMILGCAQMQAGEEALQLYAQMQEEGMVADDWTFVAVLRACSSLAAVDEGSCTDGKDLKKRCLDKVRAIHSDLNRSGYAITVFVGTILLDAYAKCGSLADAWLVFEKMPHRDVVSWNAMILGYMQVDDGVMALQLYAHMQQEGVEPDDRTFVAALKACASVAGLGKGKQIHAQISKTGLDSSDPFVISSLIDMYGKCGSMVDAQEVFDAAPVRDTVTWNALVVGYAHQGECAQVVDLFEKMMQDGIKPNSITLLSLLTACSHGGLVNKGQNYFEAMSRDYNITPTIQHYSCMVDLLGRAGQLDRAMEMVNAMPFQSTGEAWRSLLGSCRKWSNLELGRQVFECALRLDKGDVAAYVLMANIYAAAHLPEKAKEIQAMRIKAQAWKPPGQSWWTDTKGTVHRFVVADREHPEIHDIHTKVADILVEMKKQGYSPHLASVLRDISDSEKEAALCQHSERLALAYALLKTPQGTTIRIVKNLRVCEDCHTAIALISKIECRTIICRDARRFHVYKDGKCSCGDYW